MDCPVVLVHFSLLLSGQPLYSEQMASLNVAIIEEVPLHTCTCIRASKYIYVCTYLYVFTYCVHTTVHVLCTYIEGVVPSHRSNNW